MKSLRFAGLFFLFSSHLPKGGREVTSLGGGNLTVKEKKAVKEITTVSNLELPA